MAISNRAQLEIFWRGDYITKDNRVISSLDLHLAIPSVNIVAFLNKQVDPSKWQKLTLLVECTAQAQDYESFPELNRRFRQLPSISCDATVLTTVGFSLKSFAYLRKIRYHVEVKSHDIAVPVALPGCIQSSNIYRVYVSNDKGDLSARMTRVEK